MSGRIPEAFIQELLNRVDIADLIGDRVPLKRAGAEFKACCPFHDEKTPSFTVSPAKQFYHCFGCGAHGTAISFLMEYEGLDFVEAIEDLAGLCGLEVPRERGDAPASPAKSQAVDSTAVIALQERASRYFQQQLRHHPDAPRVVAYLKQRGVSGITAATFRIGFAPAGWNNLIDAFGHDQERALVTAGLAIRRDKGGCYDRFRDRLMFPILDTRGRTVGFGGRSLGEDTPKYLNSPETAAFHKGRELYGLHSALQRNRHPRRAVVVEGYMDVIALAQAGIPCPVATLGTAPATEHLQRLFRVTDQVVFCFDGDAAGRRAAERAMEISLGMLRDGRRVEFAFLPEGEDPDTQVRNGGGTAFERFLDEAIPLSDFLFNRLLDQTDLYSLDGRARLVELARPYLIRVPPGALRELLLARTADLAQLPADQVRRIITSPGNHSGGVRTQTKMSVSQEANPSPRTPPPAPVITKALRLLLTEPGCADAIQDDADLDIIELPGAELLREAVRFFRAYPDATTAMLLEKFRGRPQAAILAQIAHQKPGGVDDSIRHSAPLVDPTVINDEFRDLVSVMRRLAERQRRRALLSRKSVNSLTEKEKLDLRGLRKETIQ